MNDKIVLLDGEWDLYIVSHSQVKEKPLPTDRKSLEEAAFTHINAAVPGNFELDMINAGLLEDLYYGKNVLKAQNLEDRHLWYTRTFRWTGESNNEVILKFDGIDTISEIYLNGEKIAETDNMLIGYEIPVTGKLLENNELIVHISPVYLEAQNRINEAGCFNFHTYNAESLSIRKAPHMYGWDIMPRALSGGIWRSVSIVEKQEHRIEDNYFYTVFASEEKAEVWAYFRTSKCDDIRNCTIKVKGVCGESEFYGEQNLWHTEGKIIFYVNNPKLWWPKNMGEPNLYKITIELWYNGSLVDSKMLNFGIRNVQLVQTPLTTVEGDGEFCFYVNGKKMFVMGTNWVPLDAFHSRDKQRLPKAMELINDIGVNMIRCWGGNVYEDHDFFDYCDAHGIAVWQDFAMGCAIYPQNEDFCKRIDEEARYVVRKLRNHPSLFLWAGDNEVDETYTQWAHLERDPNKNKLTREVIPDVLAQLDPIRPYLPSSPFVDVEAFEKREYTMTPERHLWGPRDYFKSDFYKNATAHFASETGYHGCPSPESMAGFISPEKLWPWQNNDEWLTHAACMEPRPDATYAYRIPLMAEQVKTLFGEIPDNLDWFALASQISQAEALKYFIEKFRIGKWRKTGIIWWNLLDGWPQISDAIVDYYYNKKIAYDCVKRLQKPVCLMLSEPEDNTLTLVGANEYRDNVTVSYSVKDLNSDSIVLNGETVLEGFSSFKIDKINCNVSETHIYLIEWWIDGERYFNHYLCGNPPYDLEQYVKLTGKEGLLKANGFPKFSFTKK